MCGNALCFHLHLLPTQGLGTLHAVLLIPGFPSLERDNDATTPYHHRDDKASPPRSPNVGSLSSLPSVWLYHLENAACSYLPTSLFTQHPPPLTLSGFIRGKQEVSPYICKQARNLNVNLPEDDWQPGKLSVSIAQVRARAQGFQQLSSKLSQ